ncbi:alpha/beta fold hydrolase [Salininema proteolyticum]|uniref:Alpha/beta fold hydrolase n=1 Tax=Salininema proteolyticum TaxID=1607685 RepID=A0ABV8TV59_9ACTN
MKLNVHEAGSGAKTALLVHGAMSDHGTWHAVEDVLTGRGYKVHSIDMRGHGRSPRGEYSDRALGDDLVENLPAGADLAIGHSMGGRALALAADRLRPKRAVYSDPGFPLGTVPAGAFDAMTRMVKESTAESVRQFNPRWSDADIAAELEGFGRFDVEFFRGMELMDQNWAPGAPPVPSLVQLADPSLCVDPASAGRLSDEGYDVVTVAGAGHCVHRDDFGAFMGSVDAWLAERAGV